MNVLEQGQSLKNSLNQWLIEEAKMPQSYFRSKFRIFKETPSMTNEERL